jgi:hypothetical protein
MSKYGAKYLRFAPFATSNPEPAGTLPNYGAASGMGGLVKVTDAPAFNEGKAYGDNELKEYVNEFKECVIDVEVTELSNTVAASMLGATNTGGELKFSGSDSAPYCGFGFVACKQVENIKRYQGVFYPKTKAMIQGDEFSTKGDGITLTGGKLKMTAATCNTGDWKIVSDDLESEALAKSWVDSKVGNDTYYNVTVQVNGAGEGESATPVGVTAVKSGESFELVITGTATALYDNGEDKVLSISGGKYTIAAVAGAHTISVIF